MMLKKQFLICLILVLCNCGTQKELKSDTLKDNPYCNSQKEEIQKYFKLKDYTSTIELFTDFESCYNNLEEYLLKLSLLYKINYQEKLSKETFGKLITIIEKNSELTQNEELLYKARCYQIVGKKREIKFELEKIDKSNLSWKQKREFKKLDQVAFLGEFKIGSYRTIDFDLFSD